MASHEMLANLHLWFHHIHRIGSGQGYVVGDHNNSYLIAPVTSM